MNNQKNAPAPPQGHHLDNIIYLPGQPGDVLPSRSESCGKGWCLMSTYEEFQIILGVAMLIVTILTIPIKNSRPALES